jgi:hypothetical protein
MIAEWIEQLRRRPGSKVGLSTRTLNVLHWWPEITCLEDLANLRVYQVRCRSRVGIKAFEELRAVLNAHSLDFRDCTPQAKPCPHCKGTGLKPS